MKKRLRAGLIGAGRIGKLHAESIHRHCPQVQIKTMVEVVQNEEFHHWAETLGIAQIETEYQSVIDDPEIDLVFIFSPSATHADIIDAAAAAGKHIFCEKPMDLSIERAMLCKKNIAKSGVKFQLGFNRRFDHNFSVMHDRIASGELGVLRMVRITSRDPRMPSTEYLQQSGAGGLFYDMAIHDFDMLRYLTGCNVREVYARGASLINEITAQNGDCDSAIISLVLDNGALALIENCRETSYGYDQRVEILGSRAMLQCDNNTPTMLRSFNTDGVHMDKPYDFFLERYKDSYSSEVLAFVTAIHEDRDVPVGADDGLQAMFIAEAALRSWQTQRNIHVSDVIRDFV